MIYNEVTYYSYIIKLLSILQSPDSNQILLEDTWSYTVSNILRANVVHRIYEEHTIKRVRPPFKLSSIIIWNGKGRLFDLASFKAEAFSFWGELFQPQAFLKFVRYAPGLDFFFHVIFSQWYWTWNLFLNTKTFHHASGLGIFF